MPTQHVVMRRFRDQAGFTLIELLVVITILGIIAGVVVFSVGGIGDKGTDSAVTADAATLRIAEEAHCANFTGYATVRQLQAKGLLGRYATRKRYNYVSLGNEGNCGAGARSSFSIFDATAPTEFLNGKAFVGVGSGPTDVAVNPETNMVYITNEDGNSVSVMDGDTDEVVGEPIEVGTDPRQIAVSPTKNKVYVASWEDKSISVIDAGNGNAVTTLRFPASGDDAAIPNAVGVNPANGDVYVGGASTKIMRIDGTTNEARDIEAGYGVGAGAHFAFNETTNTVFFVGHGASAARLVIIDGASRDVTYASFPDPPATTVDREVNSFLAVNPETNKVYVTVRDGKLVPHPVYPDDAPTRRASGAIVIFDGNDGFAAANASGDEVPVELPQWEQITINPGTNEIYAFGTLITRVPDGSGSGGTALGAGVVGRLDGATNAYTGQAQGSPAAFGGLEGRVLYHHLVVNPTTNRIYVSQDDSGGSTAGLLAVDMTTLNATKLGEGRVFVAFAVNPETNKIYAVDRAGEAIAVLR